MKRGWLGAWQCLILATLLIGSSKAHAQLVPPGATWKYLDDGSDQGTAWTAIGFADSTWATGNTQLGYGDGDEVTVVGFGPNGQAKYPTTYFRHDFQVVNPGSITELRLHLLDDDGSIVYLNGVEVVRNNMPAGTIDFMTLAASGAGHEEDNWSTFVLNPAQLVVGTNQLAVEVHQASVESSDLSFDCELTELPLPPVVRGPYLQMMGPDRVTIRWRTDLPTDSRIQYGAAPGALTQVADDTDITTEHSVTLQGLTPDTTYYYSIGDLAGVMAGDDLDHFFRTAPVMGSTRSSRFWILGDCGSGTSDQAMVRDAFLNYTGATTPDLLLLLGDNAYTDGNDAEYQESIFDMYADTLRQTAVMSTRGNHESYPGGYYLMFDFPALGELGGLISGTEAY